MREMCPVCLEAVAVADDGTVLPHKVWDENDEHPYRCSGSGKNAGELDGRVKAASREAPGGTISGW